MLHSLATKYSLKLIWMLQVAAKMAAMEGTLQRQLFFENVRREISLFMLFLFHSSRLHFSHLFLSSFVEIMLCIELSRIDR